MARGRRTPRQRRSAPARLGRHRASCCNPHAGPAERPPAQAAVSASRARAARSRRASVRSRPRATIDSNRGGVAVFPVTATRMAMKRSPAFQPCASATPRSVDLQPLHGEAVEPGGIDRTTGGRQARPRGAAVPALRDQERRVQRDRLREEEADEVADGAQDREPLADRAAGGRRSRRRSGLRSIRPAAQSASRNGRSRSTRSSCGQAPDPLAVEPLQAPAVEDRARPSARRRGRTARRSRRASRTSSSVPGDQPR